MPPKRGTAKLYISVVFRCTAISRAALKYHLVTVRIWAQAYWCQGLPLQLTRNTCMSKVRVREGSCCLENKEWKLDGLLGPSSLDNLIYHGSGETWILIVLCRGPRNRVSGSLSGILLMTLSPRVVSDLVWEPLVEKWWQAALNCLPPKQLKASPAPCRAWNAEEEALFSAWARDSPSSSSIWTLFYSGVAWCQET